MLNGERFPRVMMTVIRFCVNTESHELKKLLTLFWEVRTLKFRDTTTATTTIQFSHGWIENLVAKYLDAAKMVWLLCTFKVSSGNRWGCCFPSPCHPTPPRTMPETLGRRHSFAASLYYSFDWHTPFTYYQYHPDKHYFRPALPLVFPVFLFFCLILPLPLVFLLSSFLFLSSR